MYSFQLPNPIESPSMKWRTWPSDKANQNIKSPRVLSSLAIQVFTAAIDSNYMIIKHTIITAYSSLPIKVDLSIGRSTSQGRLPTENTQVRIQEDPMGAGYSNEHESLIS